MTPTLIALIVSILGLAAYVVAHAVTFRFLRPQKRWEAIKRLYFVFVPLVLAMATWAYFGWRVNTEASAIDLFSCLFITLLIHVGYLTFYGFIDRSITLRTFVELQSGGNQPITFAELVKRYDTYGAYLRRLEILNFAGYLKRVGREEYTLTSKGARLAGLIKGLKTFYRLGQGG